MKRTVALVVSAALAFGVWTPAAWAQAVASAAPSNFSPALAMQRMQAWGVYGANDPVLRSYLGDENGLTMLGSAVYLSLSKRYDVAQETRAIKDEVSAMAPVLQKLAENGANNKNREKNVAQIRDAFNKQFGDLNLDAGTMEGVFRLGAMREALMTGAAINDPPDASHLLRLKTADGGYELWDSKGVVYRVTKDKATVYNRELQKIQHEMNKSRPPQAAFVPETGYYNPEMFGNNYWVLKNQLDSVQQAMRRDRMATMADLLGKSQEIREDMWTTDPTLEQDLEKLATDQKYTHRGETYSVLDVVESRLTRRRAYIEKGIEGVQRYQNDMDRLKARLKSNPIVSDADYQTLALDQQNAMRWMTLAVLETQTFAIKNQSDHLDPSAPDAYQLMQAIDTLGVKPEVKAGYKAYAGNVSGRLDDLRRILERVRVTLEKADYAGSLDLANAALTSSQRELERVDTDYSMYAQIASQSSVMRQQAAVPGWNVGRRLLRAGADLFRGGDTDYAKAMRRLEEDRVKLEEVVGLIAGGDLVKARQAVIAMNPDAVQRAFSAPLAAAPARVTESARLAASLKAEQDRLDTVAETNQWLDAAGNAVTWAVGAAVFGGVARNLTRGLGEWAEGKALLFKGAREALPVGARRNALAFLGGGFRLTGELSKHMSANFASLEPAMGGSMNPLTRGVVRGWRAFSRQAAFSAQAGVMNGVYLAVVDHGRKEAFGGHSSYASAGDAFMLGMRSGVSWSGSALYPGILYFGMPYTALQGTRFSKLAETVGVRGTVETGLAGVRASLRLSSKWTERLGLTGLSARLRRWVADPLAGEEGAATWWAPLDKLGRMENRLAKTAAFTLGTADQMSKFVLFSDAVAELGREYAYYMPSDIGGWYDQPAGTEGLERRIRGANVMEMKALMSPIWLLLPGYAAHSMSDAATYMGGVEGMRQYDKYGRTAEPAAAEPGTRLPYLEPYQVPLSMKIFQAGFADMAGHYWEVTDHVIRESIKKEIVRQIGGAKAKPGDVNPFEFYRATKLADGERFLNLTANDQVRLVAQQNFVESLVGNAARTQGILDVGTPGKTPLGGELPGVGRITPEMQKEAALALYTSELQIGKKMPARFSQRVGEILKDEIELNGIPARAAENLRKSYWGLSAKTPALDAELTEMLTRVTRKVKDWEDSGASPGDVKRGYVELVGELRARADQLKARGALSTKEHAVLAGIYDYIGAVEARFDYFNRTDRIDAQASQLLGALRVEYAGQEAPLRLIDGFTRSLREWARRGDADAAGSFKELVGEFNAELAKAKDLTPAQRAALDKAVEKIAASPAAMRTARGDPLSGWRARQFEALITTLATVASQGRAGDPVRLYQLLKTGGGKTLLAFVGLLPLVEAECRALGRKPIYLTTQSKLEAQARMDFVGFKIMGSRLEISMYDEFKGKLAQGKLDGRDALGDYWILGDEMDGAALQAALSMGGLTGTVTRVAPAYKKIADIDTGLGHRLDAPRSTRARAILTAARRAGDAGLIRAAEKLLTARGADQAAVEAELLAGARKSSLSQLAEALRASEPDAFFRRDIFLDLRNGFAHEQALLGLAGDVHGLARLSREADARTVELEARLSRLEGKAESAAELRQLQSELALIDPFRSVAPGRRLASLQDAIAAERVSGKAAPERVAEWTRQAESVESALPEELRAAARERAQVLIRLYETGRQARELDRDIVAAVREGGPVGELKVRRAALEADFVSLRAQTERLGEKLSAGEPAGLSVRDARERFRDAGRRILQEVDTARPGWEERARRLLERRRELMEAFAGGENPLYAEFRAMKESMRAMAFDERIRSGEKSVYGPALAEFQRRLNGPGFWAGLPASIALFGRYLFGMEIPADAAGAGLTRWHAARMLKALRRDPAMLAHERDYLFWKFLWSLFNPGRGDHSSSWVRSELVNQFHGFFEDPASVHYDETNNRVRAVFNGQWLELDNATRRFWEMEFDVDLTMPFKNLALATIRDVTSDRRARFISFSGTVGERLRSELGKEGIPVVGRGSEPPEKVSSVVTAGAQETNAVVRAALARLNAGRGEVVVEPWADMPPDVRAAVEKRVGHPLREGEIVKPAEFEGRARLWLEEARRHQGDADQVILRASDLSAADAPTRRIVEGHLLKMKAARRDQRGELRLNKDSVVVGISKVAATDAAAAQKAQDWLRGLREKTGQTRGGLVVIVLPDTRVLDQFRGQLADMGVKTEEIASMFSDVEYMRNYRPDLDVAAMTNLAALDTGRARVLLLDAQVAGRGLDLNYKGGGNFRGYSTFEMPVIDPARMSDVHVLQSYGRVDKDRVLLGAERAFELVTSIASSRSDFSFRHMTESSPFFVQMRENPAFRAYAGNRPVDWALVHDYVRRRAGDGSADGALMAAQYEEVVLKALKEQQALVETEQLRSSSVLDGRQASDSGRFPGVEEMR